MKRFNLFFMLFAASMLATQFVSADNRAFGRNRGVDRYDNRIIDDNSGVIDHGVVKDYDHKPAGLAPGQINPSNTYGCAECPTICYIPEVTYCPKYRCEKVCVDCPRTCYKKNCRYVPEYYTKTYCQYVPQYYTKTFCKQCPEYYYTTYTVCDKKYYTQKHCEYVPVCKYRKVCSYNNCPEPACPSVSPCGPRGCGVR